MTDSQTYFQSVVKAVGGVKSRELFSLLREGYKGMFVLLRILRDEGSMLSGDLAKRAGMSTARIAVAVKTLSKKNFVKRAHSAEDGRKVLIAITPQGEAELDKRESKLNNVAMSLLNKLTEQEKENFLLLLTKMFS